MLNPEEPVSWSNCILGPINQEYPFSPLIIAAVEIIVHLLYVMTSMVVPFYIENPIAMNSNKYLGESFKDENKRWQEIQNMILEMTSFNFSFEVQVTGKKDHIENIKIGLKMLAEELEAHFYAKGYIHKLANTNYIFDLYFILDWNGMVLAASKESCAALKKPEKKIVGQSLMKYLTKPSKAIMKETLYEIVTNKNHDKRPIYLEFLDFGKSPLPYLCNFATYNETADDSKRIIFNIIPLEKLENFKNSDHKILLEHNEKIETNEDNEIIYKRKINQMDVAKIKEVNSYILKNINKDIPNIKTLANMVGTNENKLRKGFHLIYGTSIGNFILHQRLKLS